MGRFLPVAWGLSGPDLLRAACWPKARDGESTDAAFASTVKPTFFIYYANEHVSTRL